MIRVNTKNVVAFFYGSFSWGEKNWTEGPKGFSATEISLIWIKLGIRLLKTKLEWDSGLKVCLDGMPKIILGKPDCTKFWVGITGLKNIMGDPLDMPLNSSWIVYNDNSTFEVDSVLSRTHTTITYCFFNIRFSDSLIRTKSSWFPSLWNFFCFLK